MDTVTITKKEYEDLKRLALKIKVIDETIHEDISTKELMRFQENQASLNFLNNPEEDIYTEKDLK